MCNVATVNRYTNGIFDVRCMHMLSTWFSTSSDDGFFLQSLLESFCRFVPDILHVLSWPEPPQALPNLERARLDATFLVLVWHCCNYPRKAKSKPTQSFVLGASPVTSLSQHDWKRHLTIYYQCFQMNIDIPKFRLRFFPSPELFIISLVLSFSSWVHSQYLISHQVLLLILCLMSLGQPVHECHALSDL